MHFIFDEASWILRGRLVVEIETILHSDSLMEGVEESSSSIVEGGTTQANAPPSSLKNPRQFSVDAEQMKTGDMADDEWTEGSSGFGIPAGTLELVQVPRRQWRCPVKLPLPPPSPVNAPILQEFSRPWRALRLLIPSNQDTKFEYSLMKSYEPQYTPGEPTFASEVRPSSFLEPRVAVPEAQAFLITPRLRFNLGTIEPLVCKMLVYDIVTSCRVTEEFCFRIPGPFIDKLDCIVPPVALVYILPTLQLQNLNVVLKVSKVLIGDGEIAAAPYCNPDKFSSPGEQQKLAEKAADCGVRLGQFQQPLAWGTMPLVTGLKRPMSLFRQRTCISEEQRLALILDVIRGTLKEKVIPAQCEFDIQNITSEELSSAKFTTLEHFPETSMSKLKIDDPFSEPKLSVEEPNVAIRCREVQPFCPLSLVPTLGMAGSGPVAISYVNTLYLYPFQVEKCQYRNVAIRVQLLQSELEAVRGVEETESAILRAIYRANNQIAQSSFALVSYHQKNPQFEDEMKICLPEHVTSDHHLLFTFYHVHCKKLQPNQPQQDLIGYAALPLLSKDGTIIQDGKYTVNVTSALPTSPKSAPNGAGISLFPGYVDAARNAVVDNTRTVFSCRSRLVSSVHSQDRAVAEFLSPFHGNWRAESIDDPSTHEDAIVNRLMALSHSGAPNVRYFFFMLAKFVLGYLRYGTSIVRWSAFRTLLVIFEKASWNPRGSHKFHEMNRLLHDFVHVVFDENSIDDPNGSISKTSTQTESKSVYSALLETWHNVLNKKASIEENVDTKRMSLTFSNVLLQLILKSMAMKLVDQKGVLLPTMLTKNDQVVLERVLTQLISCAGDPINGLLLQKEVNRSVAYFCRGVFLVVNNVFPARVIAQYVKWVDVQGDANNLRHIWFPFLHILVDFEFFATVNGADEKSSVKTRAWLAKAIFDKLLLIVATQKEHKIKGDAVKLLRRMFAAQVYNPRFETAESQERIALLYYPLFPSIIHLTTPGKILAKKADSFLSGEAKSILDLQKEILACIGHLLYSVADTHLPFFFRSIEENSSTLEFTETLGFYHSLVAKMNDEKKEESVFIVDDRFLYDEARVHACLALIQRLVDTFLVTSISSDQLWQQLLSPDLSVCETETGLSLLEHRLAHRQSFHRRTGGGVDTSAVIASKTCLTDSNELVPNISDGNVANKSLPRNWSKHYGGMQQRRSVPNAALEERAASCASTCTTTSETSATNDHRVHVAALQQAVASTALRVLTTAVDQYEAVIRLIEAPRSPCLDHQHLPTLRAVNMSQALVFLGSLTDLLFQLLQQASNINCLANNLDTQDKAAEEHETRADHSTASCFVVRLLQYLQAFVWRFSAALFAVRIPDLPLIHDQKRIQLLISIATTAKENTVRLHAATLLSQLFAVSYDQTGSFQLVKAPVLKVFTVTFFPTLNTFNIPISCTALRDLLDEMRSFATISRDHAMSLPVSFYVQFLDLLNDLTTKIHAFERWQAAFEQPEGPHDFEEIEEGIDRVVDDISLHWLLEEKLIWLNALLRLHFRRNCLAEAVCCKLAAIECVERAGLGRSADTVYFNQVQQWIVRELLIGRKYAQEAEWIDKELSLCEHLLSCFKQQRRFTEYQETLRYMDPLITRLGQRHESSSQRSNSLFSFYRVRYTGGCVPTLITKDEFIYKRSKFVSLGEFVAEMKTMLRAKYPQCERVDVVPEPKRLTGLDNNPNVIFLRVTTVEEVVLEELAQLKTMETPSHDWQMAFKFAVPFTLNSSSSYGKTSEQMKRLTFLCVNCTFPCRRNRQRVQKRYETTRSPIENSMDDIQKRCELLRAEIDKEKSGKTDLKTLTLVLKGSVDTHVHGGIPEVLDSFFTADPIQLMDSHGNVMNKHKSLQKRQELAILLIDFAQLCRQCLVISREAFRKSNQLGNSHLSPLLTPIATELIPHYLENDTFLPPVPHFSKSPVQIPTQSLEPVLHVEVSPLQTEFERSFALLVEQLVLSLPFSNNLIQLQQQTCRLLSLSK